VDFEIRRIPDDEHERLLRAVPWPAFGEDPKQEDIDAELLIHEPGRTFAALDGKAYVGSVAGVSFRLAVPGGSLRASGLTSAAVLPTHRRRGILTALMRRHLEEVREREEPLSLLYASEGSIYGRFGYGIATWECSLTMEPGRSGFVVPLSEEGTIGLVDREEAVRRMPPVFDRAVIDRAGSVDRPGNWWEYRFADNYHVRGDESSLIFAMYGSGGVDEGYVAYRIKTDWPDGVPGSTLSVFELIAETPRAYAALWRYCFDVDLLAEIKAWRRPPDEPLLHLVAEPRRLRLVTTDGLWVRLVDVAAALAGRRYATEGSIVLEVRDEACEWNDGRFILQGGPDGANVAATTASPELALSVADLGALYLGGNTFAALARAGRMLELAPNAITRADAMFRSDLAPWNPTIF
jgi:predicted acetyltransferase